MNDQDKAHEEAQAEAVDAPQDDIAFEFEEGDENETIASMLAQIAELTAERDDLKDKLMRSLAEAENTRRRAERDRKDAENYGGTKLARDLLSVHDNFDRALASADEDARAHAA